MFNCSFQVVCKLTIASYKAREYCWDSLQQSIRYGTGLDFRYSATTNPPDNSSQCCIKALHISPPPNTLP